MNLNAIINRHFAEGRATHTRRDTLLYALGIGACDDPCDSSQLRFVYEGNLQAIPSMASILAHPPMWMKEPELELDFLKLVHAEQHIELFSVLPTEGEITGQYRISGIADKGAGKGALMYFEKSLFAQDQSPLAKIRTTYFFRGDGGCGSWGEAGAELAAVPQTPAQGVIEHRTLPISALIYRLSGDYNPLHADPAIARKAGFERPILHGLCTFGIACLSLIRALCESDASRLRSLGARFTKPVYPGETLRTEYWIGAEGLVQFRCISVERNEIVLDRGQAQIG